MTKTTLLVVVISWLWPPSMAYSQLIPPSQAPVVREQLENYIASAGCSWQELLDTYGFKLYHFKHKFKSAHLSEWYLKYDLYLKKIEAAPEAALPCGTVAFRVERKETQKLDRGVRLSFLNEHGYYYLVSWKASHGQSADRLVWTDLLAFLIDGELRLIPHPVFLKTLKK